MSAFPRQMVTFRGESLNKQFLSIYYIPSFELGGGDNTG